MGRHKRRYSPDSSSDESDGCSNRALYKRIKKLEHCLRRKSRHSRDRERRSRDRGRRSEQTDGLTLSRHHDRDNSGYTRRSHSSDSAHDDGRLYFQRNQSPSVIVDPVIDNRDSNIHTGDDNNDLSYPGAERIASPSNIPADGHVSDKSVDHDVLSLHNQDVLSPDIASLLGNDPQDTQVCSTPVHSAIASRWGHILVNGLTKDSIKELCDKYEVPTNLVAAKSPLLNPEIVSVLQKQPVVRDTALLEQQKLLSKAIAALTAGVSLLLGESAPPLDNKRLILTNLCDSGRIICHLFYRFSQTRRGLILPLLNSDMAEAIKNCPPGDFLYGSELGERIKAAKNLISVSKDIKKPILKSPHSGAGAPTTKKTPYKRNLNVKRPIRAQRGAESTQGHSSATKKEFHSPKHRSRSVRRR